MNDDGWDDIDAHGNQLPIDDKPVIKKRYGVINPPAWGDEIPLADTLAAINGAKKAKQKKRKDTQRIGKNSEARARRVLERMGFERVKKLSTKFNGTWAVKADADFEGVWPENGKDMLCEVKHTEKPRLLYSALRKHQSKNLSNLARRNGYAFLIWTYEKEKLVMRWGVDGIDGFVPGTSLKIERARELSIVGGQPALWSVKK